jgi:hypothetical protein
MRLGALAWARDLARVQRFAAIRERLQRDECPCCGEVGVKESPIHFMMSCSAWAEQRTQYLVPILTELTEAGRIRQVAGQPVSAPQAAAFCALLGGVGPVEVDAWNSAVAGLTRTRLWWLSGRREANGAGRPPPFIMVARFIAEARRARWTSIRNMLDAAAGAGDASDASTGESSESEEDDTEAVDAAGAASDDDESDE